VSSVPPALEDRLQALEQRNRRVELNKRWETSWVRRICIAALTYVVVSVYLALVVHINPWINALVPTMGFLVSTLALGAVRSVWERWVVSRQEPPIPG